MSIVQTREFQEAATAFGLFMGGVVIYAAMWATPMALFAFVEWWRSN